MNIKLVDVKNLVPYDGNPRIEGKGQIDVLQQSLTGYGFVEPIIAYDDPELPEGKFLLIVGHKRYKAVLKNNEKRVPVIVYPFENRQQAIAYCLASNKTAEMSRWDMPKLKDNIELLDTGEFNLELTGWKLPAIEDLMTWTKEPKAKEESICPEEKKETVCPKCGHSW